MLTRIHDMPAGTLGFEAVGEVDDDDVEKVLVPALTQWVAQRGKIRLLYVLGTRLRTMEDDAVSSNAKFVAHHPTAFERVAVVSDDDWLRPAVRALSLLLPGQVKAFPIRGLALAKQWLADGLDPADSPTKAGTA